MSRARSRHANKIASGACIAPTNPHLLAPQPPLTHITSTSVFFDYQSFATTHELGAPVAQNAVDAQLDAFIVQYYGEGDYCAFPESCRLDQA